MVTRCWFERCVLRKCRLTVEDKVVKRVQFGAGAVDQAAQRRRLGAPSLELIAQTAAAVPAAQELDELCRQVYCVLGIPIDVIEMPEVLRAIETAAKSANAFVISTPNLNFLVNSQDDVLFRESLLASNLCPADGMPIVWIAKLLGLPLKHRIAGSDIFEALKTRQPLGRPLKVFLFGATESVAAAAAKALSAKPDSLVCVGWSCPGFGSLAELSGSEFIDKVNASGADFLVVALGAKKGQMWLQLNHERLRIPIRSHLGATINFQAGTIKRAPVMFQKLGMEWVWRIKEEPYLWRRYLHDGAVLLRLLVTRVLPLAISARSLQWKCRRGDHNLVIERIDGPNSVTLRLIGFATAQHVDRAIACFRFALGEHRQIVIDLTGTKAIDQRFLGLVLLVRKQLKAGGSDLTIAGVSRDLRRTFRLNGVEYLLGG